MIVTSITAIQCEYGSVYLECGSPSEQTCENLGEGAAPYCNDTHCVEGCFCPPGTVRDGKVYFDYSSIHQFVN